MGLDDPGGAGNPFQGLLNDLLKVIGGAAGGNNTAWLDAARSLAQGVATDGQPEPNADPLARIALEELARVTELHVADVTGLPVGPDDRPTTFVPVGRGAWALRVLDAWVPTLTRMVDAQRRAGPPPGPTEEDAAGGLEELLGRFAGTMGPVLLGMQFGSAAGHLAQRALGQYAMPLPWPPSHEVLLVPENIARFAEDWSLPADEARLWVCVQELAAHAVLSRPFVAERIRSLTDAVAGDTLATQAGLAERLGGEATDPESLQRLLADPESLLADLLTPGQQRTSADLVALTTAVTAYVDHVTARITGSLTGSAGALREAWYRHRIEGGAGEQAAGALFGLELDRAQVDRGSTFVRGVLERAGEDGLARLWTSDHTLPTPAELDAPGLWLERIDLPGE